MENGDGTFDATGLEAKHLIDGDGTFDATGLDNFIKQVKLGDCGLSYAVVSIMGPLGSGKSTLLNHLFDTNFKEMDAYRERCQTTKGIWMSCAGNKPFTIVMDLEGTDTEDNTAFEKQSALFAFSVSDIVIINMWCHDIRRKQASMKPLLKTVFQDMFRLFNPHKTTLMFVIRDHTKTPLEKLESVLREDIQKIWDSVPKPKAHELTKLSDFYDVKVDALSSYEEREEEFKKQVVNLREKFVSSMVPCCPVVPASEFSSSAQKIWEAIKQNKNLDLAEHNIKEVKRISQPVKVMSNLKKIVDLELGDNKVGLMEGCIFNSLSSVKLSRESSATLIAALCRSYDQDKKRFQLNKDTYFSFCTEEVAKTVGMKDEGISFAEYTSQKSQSSDFLSLVKGLRTKFSSGGDKNISTREMKEILKKMTVDDDESKQNFRKLMTFFIIKDILMCGNNNIIPNKDWWLVADLDACHGVNWAKATEDHLHKSLKEAKSWLENHDDSEQLTFTGAAPVLEAILYNRISVIRPKQCDGMEPSIQKWKSQRRDHGWAESAFRKLTSCDIEPCEYCTAVPEIVYPSRNARCSVLIRRKDMPCLKPEQWLCDSIIEFYIRYLQQNTSQINRPISDYHFFNTVFYTTIKRDDVSTISRKRLTGLCDGENIFQKAYIFIPVNQDRHWSVVLICMPHEKDKSGEAIMLHLDSLNMHNRHDIFDNIIRFMQKAEKYFQIHPLNYIVDKVVCVPQQENNFDCGIFVLLYIEYFIKRAPIRMKVEHLKMFDEKWFEAGHACALRSKMEGFLADLFETESQGKKPTNIVYVRKRGAKERKEVDDHGVCYVEDGALCANAGGNLIPELDEDKTLDTAPPKTKKQKKGTVEKINNEKAIPKKRINKVDLNVKELIESLPEKRNRMKPKQFSPD